MSTEQERTLSRREFRRMMEKKKRRLRRRRQARVRRVRFWRTVRSIRFWARVLTAIVVFLTFSFWAKFAFVYNIPSYAATGQLENVKAYVAVKPWWFGPPVFDLGDYVNHDPMHLEIVNDPYAYLLLRLGRYSSIVEHPNLLWSEDG